MKILVLQYFRKKYSGKVQKQLPNKGVQVGITSVLRASCGTKAQSCITNTSTTSVQISPSRKIPYSHAHSLDSRCHQ
jgi:hypothetical protein